MDVLETFAKVPHTRPEATLVGIDPRGAAVPRGVDGDGTALCPMNDFISRSTAEPSRIPGETSGSGNRDFSNSAKDSERGSRVYFGNECGPRDLQPG